MNNINSNCKSYESHFLEYIIGNSTSGGICDSSGSETAQEVVSLPHKALFNLGMPCFHPAI